MSWLTKRVPTMLVILLLTLLTGGGFYWAKTRRPTADPELTPQQVRITNVQDNKFSVSWTTTKPAEGSIEWGAGGEKLTQAGADDRDVGGKGKYLTHHVTILGLQPNTPYAFRIVSGETGTRFDNNGSPYAVTTGAVIGSAPPSKNFYGSVALPSKLSPEGAIVYVMIPGAAVASTLVTSAGNYAVTLSTIRTSDLRDYVKVDPSATIANVTVVTGQEQSVATVSLANAAPVPLITLGQNVDFRTNPGNTEQTPGIAEVVPKAETPQIFNVEPLAGAGNTVAAGENSVVILNPSAVDETLYTLRPELRGTGPKGTTLSIAITGQKSVSGTATIATDGTWTWAPTVDLKEGTQTVVVSYIGSGGTEQKTQREFIVATPSNAEIAFVATPSASKKASPIPSVIPSPSVRAAMPATDSGVPVTGVISNTIMLMMAGAVAISLGLLLLL